MSLVVPPKTPPKTLTAPTTTLSTPTTTPTTTTPATAPSTAAKPETTPAATFEANSSTTTTLPPAAKPTTTTSALLVGRAGPVPPSTPRFTLKEAVLDPSFTSKDPATIPVPKELLDEIKGAKRVLLIGHTGPDGDCVGTTLAMQRALTDLGKVCDVCVDDVLTGSLRTLDTDHQVKRASDLQDKSWDLALVMDVAGPERIGGGADLVLNAKSVAVVDHHMVSPKAAHFGLAPEQRFTSWVETDFPCAALCAAAILGHLKPELDAVGHQPKASMTAALCGFATDTGWGTFQGLDKEKFRFFKHMLVDNGQMQLSDVENALRYDLPPSVVDVLEGKTPTQAPTKPEAQALLSTLAALQAAGNGISSVSVQPKNSNAATSTKPDPASPPPPAGVGVMAVSDAFVDAALALGHLDDPGLVDMDLTNVLKWGAVKDLAKTHKVAAFLIEKDGDIFVSLRGEPGTTTANRLATALGGGGHAVAAGARVKDASIAEVRARIVDWCRAEGIA